MFFEDPVAAFTNLRRNAAPGGRLIFAAWGPVSANPHWQKPLELAEALLGPGQPRRPHAPGPQAFDDPDYVRAILRDSGWRDYEVEAVPVFLRGASLDDEARVACFMGPSGALLDEKNATPAQREAFHAAIRAALPEYTRMTPEGRVLLPGTIHLLTARNT
jgi:hypothetical protein